MALLDVSADLGERASGDAGSSLVFLRDKSTATLHGAGCIASGAAFVWPDGETAPLRSKASNRCPGCARIAAFEAMTMLRQDAEEHSAPAHVLTLTNRTPDMTAGAYRQACSMFWRAFRKRWGHVEYCGFVEWTTGEGPRSGGRRRLHSHWLVKGLAMGVGDRVTASEGREPCTCGDSLVCVECWTAAEWRKLTGAWIVQARELRSVGGVVGYLALHHEKMEQAPPPGWTGRRLRPSRGYFARPGAERRERARSWLSERRQRSGGLETGGLLARALRGSPRLVWGRTEAEKRHAALIEDAPPPGHFGSIAARQAGDVRLLRAAEIRALEPEIERLARIYFETRTMLARRSWSKRRSGVYAPTIDGNPPAGVRAMPLLL